MKIPSRWFATRVPFEWEGHLNQWEWQTSEVEDWQRQESHNSDRDHYFITQAHRFLTMEGRSDPLCTLDEGVQTLRTNLAILASVEQASWRAHSNMLRRQP